MAHPDQYLPRPGNARVGNTGGGTFIPIGPRHAITANHVGVSTGKIWIDGVGYRVRRTIPHPAGRDLKLIEITGPPYFLDWSPLHDDPLSLTPGTPVHIGGWGRTTASPGNPCIPWGDVGERWARNTIEGVVAPAAVVWYRFDAERSNEGIATLFDSGSFLGVEDPDHCRLTLVGVATGSSNSTGPTCDGNAAYYLLIDDWVRQTARPICPGDLDADSDTDVLDFGILIKALSQADGDCARRSEGDLDMDGRVTILDFAFLADDFGCVP